MFVALDLQMVVSMCISYALGLRVSDVYWLNRGHWNFDGMGSSLYADPQLQLDRSKADSDGDGYSRLLQHNRCEACAYQYRCAAGNAEGRAWSVASSARYQLDDAVTPGSRCHVCLLHMLLDMQGDAPDDAPLFCDMAAGARWSWQGGEHGRPEHFSTRRMPYRSYNQRLHELLKQVNVWRESAGMVHWPLSSVHWHMFRHGHTIMSLIFRTPEAEMVRKLRMKPETLASYRAHVVSTYGILFDAAQTNRDVQRRANETEGDRMAAAAVAADSSVDFATMRRAIVTLCDLFNLEPAALRRMPPTLRQIFLYGAAGKQVIPSCVVGPLLTELRGTDTPGTQPMALPAGVPVSSLITEVVVPLAQCGVLNVSEVVPAVDEYLDDGDDIREDDAGADGCDGTASQAGTQVGDGGSNDDATQVAHVSDLRDAWQLLHAQAMSMTMSV